MTTIVVKVFSFIHLTLLHFIIQNNQEITKKIKN